MPGNMSASEMLTREFPQIRHRLIDIAAALDRIDRAEGANAVQSDSRLASLREAARVLTDGRPDRAQRVQMVFSDPYDPGWRDAEPR